MERERYNPIPHCRLEPEVGTYRFDALAPRRLRPDSPAIEAMTDLRRVPVITIEPNARLDVANQAMIQHGVRLLVVMGPGSKVAGIITASDILGEKPVAYARGRSLRFDELRVQDIMTPREQVEALSLLDVLHAHVGHIVATLQQSGRQHALVVDYAEDRQMIRGIFSLTHVGRMLGVVLQASEVARSFAEIEAAIAR